MLRVTRGMLATAVVAVAGLSMLLVGLASADHSGGVTVEVQASTLSITVAGTPDLGIIVDGGTADTTGGDGSNDILVTNGDIALGGLEINANQTGNNPSGTEANCSTGTDWDLVEANSGEDEFILRADTDDSFVGSNTEETLPADNSGVELTGAGVDLAALATTDIDLEITLGSPISQTNTACPISLTVTAIPV